MESKNKRGVIVYLGIVGLTLAGFALTLNGKTWEALRSLNPLGFFPILALWLAGISLDSISLMFFIRAGGSKITLKCAFKNTFIRLFFNVVTPSSFGGQPFAIAALKGAGVPLGGGSAAVFSKTAAYSLANFGFAFVAMILMHERLRSVPAVGPIFLASGILGFGGIALFLVALFVPALLIPALRFCVKLLGRLAHIFRKKFDGSRFLRKSIHECALARRTFKGYFRHGKWSAIAGSFTAALIHLVNLSILSCVFQFLGLGIGYGEGIVLGSLLFFLISFMPTPGGSGLGEAVFAAIFAKAVPLHLLGVAILVWRTFNQYINSAIGALVSAKHFSNLKA